MTDPQFLSSALSNLKYIIDAVEPFTEAAWKDFSSLFMVERISKGEFFCREQENAPKIAFVYDGVLRAFYTSNKATEYNKTFFIENSLAVSLSSVLTGAPSFISIQALTNTDIITTRYSRIVELFDTHACIERFTRKVIEIEWIKKEKREVDVVTLDATELYKVFQVSYPDLENRIPQYHIASHLGITPVQLSRIRAK